MFTYMKRWGGFLVLGAVLLWGPGALPAWAEEKVKASAQGSDFHQFTGELHSIGALKFYEDTEDLLRSGKFERAFSRYVFLNSHIRGQAMYAGLTAMVEQRLHFLKSQLGLPEHTPHYVHIEPEKRKPRARRAPPCPPAKKADKKPGADGEEKAPEIVIPPTVTAEPEKTPPPEEKKPPADEAQKPEPPPSFWDKLKRRLKFW